METTPAPLDDNVAAGFQRGERWAFDAAARDYFTPLVNFITHLLHDRDRALELAQEAFFLACRAHHKVDPDRPLAPWLYQIARNVAYKDYNKRKKSPEVSLDGIMENSEWTPSSSDSSPRRETVRKEIWEKIDCAIKRMKPKYRDILILRVIQGLPSERVSEMLGIPVSTVNTQTHRAIQILRRMARQEGLKENELFV